MPSTSMRPQVIEAGEADISAAVSQLGVEVGTPVVVLVGGAGNLDDPPPNAADDEESRASRDREMTEIRSTIVRFLERSLGPAVRDSGAVVLTGGTDAGVMRIAGEVLADDARMLIGVVPRAMVTGPGAQARIEPRHNAIVLTPGTLWGAETRPLFALAEAITGHRGPGLVVVANGGSITLEEVERFTDGGWPVAVVPGTRGAAELLAVEHAQSNERATKERVAGLRNRLAGARPSTRPDGLPALGKPLPSTVDLEVLSADAAKALSALEWRLSTDTLLKSAWARYAALDGAANRYGRASRSLRRLAVAGFLLPVALATWFVQVRLAQAAGDHAEPTDAVTRLSAWIRDALFLAGGDDGRLEDVTASLRVVLVFLPIALAVSVAIAAYLRPDQRWRAARAGAETLLSRIYRYRAALAEPADRSTKKVPSARSRLAATMRAVDTQLLQEGIPLASLGGRVVRALPAHGVHPDPLAPLTPRLYLRHRVADQLEYFRRAHSRRDRAEKRASITAGAALAVAAWTAGTEWAPWFAFLLLAVATFAIVRIRQQVREQLETFDRAVADIEDARLAWDAATGVAQLVRSVEAALGRQGDAWVSNMNRGAKQASDYAGAFSG